MADLLCLLSYKQLNPLQCLSSFCSNILWSTQLNAAFNSNRPSNFSCLTSHDGYLLHSSLKDRAMSHVSRWLSTALESNRPSNNNNNNNNTDSYIACLTVKS